MSVCICMHVCVYVHICIRYVVLIREVCVPCNILCKFKPCNFSARPGWSSCRLLHVFLDQKIQVTQWCTAFCWAAVAAFCTAAVGLACFAFHILFIYVHVCTHVHAFVHMRNTAMHCTYLTMFLLWLCSVRSAIAEAENDSSEDDFLSLRMKTKEEKVTIITTNVTGSAKRGLIAFLDFQL